MNFISLSRFAALSAIRLYQIVISPWLGTNCRFSPSCSCYAAECLQTHALSKASWLTLKRLLRCHPWGSSGYDPVPPHARSI